MFLPISVVFLLQDLCFGGTQRQTLELAKRLDRTRFAPVLWTLSGPTDLDGEAEEAGLPLRHLGKTVYPRPLFPMALWRQLRAEPPDVLVPCTALPNIWGRILGGLARVPIMVGTCRGGGAPARQHERFLWRLAHHMVCNSLPLQAILHSFGMAPDRVTYIPNGVDAAFFTEGETPVSQRPPVILCVGRLAEDKDHMTLLRAFGQVLERIPDARLHLVGDGPQAASLRQAVADPRFRETVSIFPATRHTLPHYQHARVFALSSVREGQPNVILEAMSCGLPVAATEVGGIPNLVRQGISGLLSPAGDAARLADSLVRLLEDPSLGASMGRAGRRRVETDFAFEAMVRAHEQLFEKLWAGRRGLHG